MMRLFIPLFFLCTGLSAQSVLNFNLQHPFEEFGNGPFIHEVKNEEGAFFLLRKSSIINGYAQVYKTDSEFNLLWEKDLGYLGYSSTANSFYMTPSNDGGCYVGFSFKDSVLSDGDSNFDYIIYKLSHNGDIVWEKILGSNGHESGSFSFDERSNNTLITALELGEISGTFSDSSIFHQIEIFNPFEPQNGWMNPFVIAELDALNGEILSAFAPYDSIYNMSFTESQLFVLSDDGYVLLTNVTTAGFSWTGNYDNWTCQGQESLTYKRFSADHQLLSSICIPELIVSSPFSSLHFLPFFREDDYVFSTFQIANSGVFFLKLNLLTGAVEIEPLNHGSGPQVFLDDIDGSALGITYNFNTNCSNFRGVGVYDSDLQIFENFCANTVQTSKVVRLDENSFLFRTSDYYYNGTFGGCYYEFNLNGEISGLVFLDENSNQIFDQNEKRVSQARINYNGAETAGSIWTNPQGMYQVQAKQGSFELGLETPPWFAPVSTPLSVDIDNFYDLETRNFAVNKIADVTELSIELVPNSPIPGLPWAVKAIINNNGTLDANAKFRIAIPSATFFSSASIPHTIEGNAVVIDPGTLPALESTVVDLFFTELSTANFFPGDSIAISASLDLIADAVSSNNQSNAVCKVISESYPNSVRNLRGNLISYQSVQQSQPFRYLVQCQNIFDTTVTSVRLNDRISPENFELGSLKILASSHPLKVYAENNGRIEWAFNEIELLPSTENETLSKAWFLFEITPNTTLNEGDLISKNIRVNFNYFPSLFTNTDSTYISSSSQIKNLVNNDLQVFPNPTNRYTTLVFNNQNRLGGKIEITGLEGRLLHASFVEGNLPKKDIDFSAFSPGLYLIRYFDFEKQIWLSKKMLLMKEE